MITIPAEANSQASNMLSNFKEIDPWVSRVFETPELIISSSASPTSLRETKVEIVKDPVEEFFDMPSPAPDLNEKKWSSTPPRDVAPKLGHLDFSAQSPVELKDDGSVKSSEKASWDFPASPVTSLYQPATDAKPFEDAPLMRLRPKHSILNNEALTRFKTHYVKKTVRRKSTLGQPAAKRRKHISEEEKMSFIVAKLIVDGNLLLL
mmetsp:Transcript_16507/g.26153  ORF Transcript_16507/g.26153 Transcript_16507/m.26153 type:complete len:207 (-) Transcript_16507:85-705(-)